MKTRIYFLDNLRTLMILLVVIIHAGIVYEPVLENTWLVVDPARNDSIGLIRMYLDIFVMFTLFFISGYFIPASVNKQSTAGFMLSKFRRIMVPWIVAVLTLIPAYKFIFLYSRGLPQEEWYSYFHFFSRPGGNPFFFADNPAQNWLWFLPVLFMFQLLYLALARTGLLKRRISLRTGVMLTFLAGLLYGTAISMLGWTGWTDTAILHFQNERLVTYFASFLLGSLCYSRGVFDSAVSGNRNRVISNLVLTVSLGLYTVFALNLFFNLIDPGREYYLISGFGDRVVFHASLVMSMLSFLYVLLDAFRHYLNRTNRWLAELSANSYQVYIIHVLVLGVLALVLLKVSIPAMAKYGLLALSTFILSNLLVSSYREIMHRKAGWKTAAAGLISAVVLFAAFNYNPAGNQESGMVTAGPGNENPVPAKGLHEAVIEGDSVCVKEHIAAGSDLDVREPSAGSTPLISAATFGQRGIARLLMEGGAHVNLQNKEGSTALHAAAFFCRKGIVGDLLEHGADPGIRNNAGSTPRESVTAPWEAVSGIYQYFMTTLGPLGLQLDLETLRDARPEIARMLENATSNN